MSFPVIPACRLFRIINGGTPTSDLENWGDEVAWATPIDLARYNGNKISSTQRSITYKGLDSGSREVPEGSIILSTRAPIGYVVETTSATAFNQGCKGMVPIREADIRFFRYQLSTMTEQLRSYGQGSTFLELSADDLGTIPLAVPSCSIQRQVADHLDIETARIEALISKKRRLIELIEEQWDTWVREQLKSLPCPLLPLKRTWRVIDCKHRTPAYVDHGYPVVSPGDISPGRLDLSRAHRFVGEIDYRDLADGVRKPKRKDILYSRNASIGIASYVDIDESFCMGQDVCLITSDDMDQLYLMYVLNSIGLDQLEVIKIGSTFDRVNISQILEIKVPVPSLNQQQTLACRMDDVASHMSKSKEIIEKQIDLLQERRQALVTAVVTGDMSVSGVSA